MVHREELGERVSGLMAAYLLWMGLVPDGPRAVNVTEQLFERELGPIARELVAMVAKCAPTGEVEVDAFTVEAAPIEDDPTDPGGDESVSADASADSESN